jgi:hypothetical protein
MGNTDNPTRPKRNVRTLVTDDLHERIAHLAITRHTTIGELVVEALVLLCRYYDHGAGFPAPVLHSAPQAAKVTSTTTALTTPPSLREGAVPPAAAVAVVADVDDYFSIDAVLRDAGVGGPPSHHAPEEKEKGQ